MTRVCIGIHVHAEPPRLEATLASLRANTPELAACIPLPDGPDAPTSATLAAMRDLPQSGSAEPLGAPACFNRLIAGGDADVFVFLESGVLVGPGWLGHLLAALDADPRNGLAGPSTNRSWNEQAVFPQAGPTPSEIAAAAREASRRFGSETRALEPLHSLADFCYAVRREVVEAVGCADERYGLGPCWEMDYNIRAARAGWRGVWACAAYVHRSPVTARRRLEEASRFEASKRLYQDKFCGGRLRGDKTDYRPHCRGDDCPNFAPATLIEIQRSCTEAGENSPVETVPPTPPNPRVISQDGDLITCIMPTYNRRAFVPQAVRNFLRQDFPNAELIVVDDGTDAIADCLPNDSRIRYVRLEQRLTIGAKRNLACVQARGDVIVHWDDDDWYPPWRLRAQAAALREHGAEVCGSAHLYYYDAGGGRAWTYHYRGRPNTWAAGNTLAYLKSYWKRSPFPAVQVGEDTRFLWDGRPRGLCDLANPSLCVAMIHAGNVSPKATNGSYWRPCADAPIRQLLGEDLAFYQSVAVTAATPAMPLVSCIMPTYNRRAFLPLALAGFEAQDYPNKELIIVDDGSDPVGDLVEGRVGVHYLRLPRRASIGAKRNLACAKAAGQFIAHWDDDDWYASNRVSYQLAPILRGEADITGLENAFVLALPDGEFWTTHAALHQRMFVGDVHGGTLVYRKALLERGLRYPDVNLAEDAALLQQAMRRGGRLTRLANCGVFVYMRHGGNAWCFEAGRFLDPAGWRRTAGPAGFPADLLSSYQTAAEATSAQEVLPRK